MGSSAITTRPAIRQISLTAARELEEPLSGFLEALFDSPPSIVTREGSPDSVVSVFIPVDSRSVTEIKQSIRLHLESLSAHGISIAGPKISVRRIRNQDWSESWKRHFRPIEINQHLRIAPPWGRRKARPGQHVVTLDPGMSFGTGHHPTTHFCLKHLAEFASGTTDSSLLDIGTGSGILAIAAAKLGFQPVCGFDFDPDAVQSARANADRNNVSREIRFFQADLATCPPIDPQHFSVVCANLTHDLLKAHRKPIAEAVEVDGLLCLAGILNHQFPEVEASFNEIGFACIDHQTQNEWTSGAFQRPRQ